MAFEHHLFISHASADKADYIQPLVAALASRSLTYWLDSAEILWGDSITGRINEGLRSSEYGLLCLSERYIERPWPESEMAAVFALQNTSGKKRVLPLILSGRDAVLQRYPLIGGLAYREFSAGVTTIADELSKLLQPSARSADELRVSIESAHSGHIINLAALRRASVQWLIEKATSNAGLRSEADVGAFDRVQVKWVLVDVRAESEWQQTNSWDQERIVCIVRADHGIVVSRDYSQRLDELGVPDGTIFHLYAIPERGHRIMYVG